MLPVQIIILIMMQIQKKLFSFFFINLIVHVFCIFHGSAKRYQKIALCFYNYTWGSISVCRIRMNLFYPCNSIRWRVRGIIEKIAHDGAFRRRASQS